ncbi:uncharacterized protein THITE_110267 [Thermothielavioides terrestris NRRL 8126]|uniref:Uncharacterized protein n=1 Tax=Thermothielavioides terrestris (strain ATCC 38088 / NRRL 8126) TaxID=578455 RepID=G2R4E1_THETT|nr:uncharacterized protein THITE_110267 [Thermothielavioides terrestris NRRL 8126]AEO66885.1 hypothetical protein THITE_110267 [Thermothielavioides terrestris NRRL 8126]
MPGAAALKPNTLLVIFLLGHITRPWESVNKSRMFRSWHLRMGPAVEQTFGIVFGASSPTITRERPVAVGRSRSSDGSMPGPKSSGSRCGQSGGNAFGANAVTYDMSDYGINGGTGVSSPSLKDDNSVKAALFPAAIKRRRQRG